MNAKLEESCQRPGFWIIEGREVCRTKAKKTTWEIYYNDELVHFASSLDEARALIANEVWKCNCQ